MSEALWYYVCDRCGDIADIAASPHGDGITWACASCNGERLSEFTDSEEALTTSQMTRTLNYRAEMATLDRRIRDLDDRRSA